MKKISILMILILGISSSLYADDTDIYGVGTVNIPPNVLILFDNSGSMDTEDVPGDSYNPATTYTGSYSTNTVYRRSGSSWVSSSWTYSGQPSVNTLPCTAAKNALLSVGYWSGSIRLNGNCGGGTSRDLRLGNYRNYLALGIGDDRRRIDVAKEVITDLINDKADELRFGVFIFNHNDGGRLLQPLGTDKTTLINSINALDPETWTPLAETLAEMGLYYAGKPSWFNSGVTYTSPMQQRCQKNYIIVMTDGEPTQDRNWRLRTGTYILGNTISDYDADGHEAAALATRSDGYVSYSTPSTTADTSDYLDDVAKYLFDNDINTSMGSVGDFEKQNIITYTVGFQTDNTVLEDTASNGGGEYYTATNSSSLKEAFDSIISKISTANAVFVAPVVPVSKLNSAYAGDRIYIGFFKPTENGRWFGNIKKYGLAPDGAILDANGNPATEANGTIKATATSYWSGLPDGPVVEDGGVGEVLLGQSSRNIYTYMGTANKTLTHTDNRFSYTNPLITNTVLGVATDTARQALIDDFYNLNGSIRSWTLGDFIHSKPAVIHYTDKTVIYAANNGGSLHAFDDGNGQELWAYIPDDQLGRLNLLSDSNTSHDYFVDAAPSVYQGTSQTILFVGERRGGDYYHVLDVTSYNSPVWLYEVGPSHLGGGSGTLGQSWASPEIATIKTSTSQAEVFLMAGGYDTNQDSETPAAADTVGRAVFSINVGNGAVSSLNFNAGNFSQMTHSVVDLSGFDHDGDGIVSRVYAGDLGGNMFVFRDDDSNGVTDGTWTAAKLFSASAADGVQRKIFHAPDAVKEHFGEFVFFGTGDRENPWNTTVVNRLYAVKNDFVSMGLMETGLLDVTADLIQLGTAEQKIATQNLLDSGKGWFIRLENPGEKVVSTPVVFGGVVYFTTYTPDPGGGFVDPSDPCSISTARGAARLYALNYKTGGSSHDWSGTTEYDAEGNVVNTGKEDRSVVIGTSIPSSPVIAILEGGPQLYIGIEGGVENVPPNPMPGINLYYWRQLVQ